MDKVCTLEEIAGICCALCVLDYEEDSYMTIKDVDILKMLDKHQYDDGVYIHPVTMKYSCKLECDNTENAALKLQFNSLDFIKGIKYVADMMTFTKFKITF